ncbi:Arm DNA-binding domain-containing protein [Brucella gallinifaecis]
MLTDTKLRNLKTQAALYKVNDRDGLYVVGTPADSISFRYNYAIHRQRYLNPHVNIYRDEGC